MYVSEIEIDRRPAPASDRNNIFCFQLKLFRSNNPNSPNGHLEKIVVAIINAPEHGYCSLHYSSRDDEAAKGSRRRAGGRLSQ